MFFVCCGEFLLCLTCFLTFAFASFCWFSGTGVFCEVRSFANSSGLWRTVWDKWGWNSFSLQFMDSGASAKRHKSSRKVQWHGFVERRLEWYFFWKKHDLFIVFSWDQYIRWRVFLHYFASLPMQFHFFSNNLYLCNVFFLELSAFGCLLGRLLDPLSSIGHLNMASLCLE